MPALANRDQPDVRERRKQRHRNANTEFGPTGHLVARMHGCENVRKMPVAGHRQ